MNPFAKQIINLETIIDYQDHAIVSKTITDNTNSSLTVFAFDAGQSIAGHTVLVDAVVLNIEGEIEITISEQKYTLQKGDMILMPKGEPHAVRAPTKFKMVLFKV